VIDAENTHCNTNHAVIGYYVAKSWNLPGYICETIADHHSTDKIFATQDYGKPEKKNLLAILKIAEHICDLHHTLANQSTDHQWARLEEDILSYTGLSQYDFQGMKETCTEQELGSSGYFAD